MLTKRSQALQAMSPIDAAMATGAKLVVTQTEGIPAEAVFFGSYQAPEMLTTWGCSVHVPVAEAVAEQVSA
ncbi:MAG: hypothetical protein GC134_02205 [Proteobacteria bacterium]|nr:hypothetical protein [Pseudomonadota bacterium]